MQYVPQRNICQFIGIETKKNRIVCQPLPLTPQLVVMADRGGNVQHRTEEYQNEIVKEYVKIQVFLTYVHQGLLRGEEPDCNSHK